jgi:hypothetical protein
MTRPDTDVRRLESVVQLESEADALRSENLRLRQQLAACESREAALAHPDIHAVIAETEPPSMDAEMPRIVGG